MARKKTIEAIETEISKVKSGMSKCKTDMINYQKSLRNCRNRNAEWKLTPSWKPI